MKQVAKGLQARLRATLIHAQGTIDAKSMLRQDGEVTDKPAKAKQDTNNTQVM